MLIQLFKLTLPMPGYFKLIVKQMLNKFTCLLKTFVLLELYKIKSNA